MRIIEHRRIYFRYSWMDYDHIGSGFLRILPAGDRLAEWRSDYEAMKTEMLYGDDSNFDTILANVAEFEDRFNNKISAESRMSIVRLSV